ncbi:hypothetical protein [Nonomuraea sp. NPDC023979]|uniref:hypothetical protein n=1 Tax=Nonomuraea sp. NPDC023979 TaxID=3154796 RepID=UPI003408FA2F
MAGRHRAAPGAVTEPIQIVRQELSPPIDPAPKTASMLKITAADVAEWEQRRKAMSPEEWLEPLRHGGTRTERRMRATMRERGQLLARRVSDQAKRLRAALAKGGRR